MFYFNRKKCLQLVNFASKFTLFLIDIQVSELGKVPNYLLEYLFDFYKKDSMMTECLKKMLGEHPLFVYSKLTNRSIISTLNHTEWGYLCEGGCVFINT